MFLTQCAGVGGYKSAGGCRLGAKVNLIMQAGVKHSSAVDDLSGSDEEALALFANLNPDTPPVAEESEEDEPMLGRLKKLKKGSKKEQLRERKKSKRKEKKEKHRRRKERKMKGIVELSTPMKKQKKEGSTKRKSERDGSVAGGSDAGSSEFDSQSEGDSDMREELSNLRSEGEEATPRKRLRKSNRKSRIEQREGFNLAELGNDAEVNVSAFERGEESDGEYSSYERKKRTKTRKSKAKVQTNEQMMNSLKQREGVVEEDEDGPSVSYDNELQVLDNMKGGRKKGIRVSNKFFADLELELGEDPEQLKAPPEDLKLELKPREKPLEATSSSQFLEKIEKFKKERGMKSSFNTEEYQKQKSEQAKHSLARVISQGHSFHEDLDLEINIPTIVRGRSADLVNNTVFLSKFASKQELKDETPSMPRAQTKSVGSQGSRGMSREQYYRQLKEQNSLRRSKYVSKEQIKNSLKVSTLEELEKVRKKMLEKKRRQAYSDEESEEEEEVSEGQRLKDEKMRELLRQEEEMCQQEDSEEEGESEEEEGESKQERQGFDGLKEQNIEVRVENAHRAESEMQQQGLKQTHSHKKQAQQQQNQQLEEYNQIMDELMQSESSHPPIEEVSEEEEQEQGEQMVEQSSHQHEQIPAQAEPAGPELTEEMRQEMRQMEEEGIVMRKKLREVEQEGQREQANPEQQAEVKEKVKMQDSTEKKRDYIMEDDEQYQEQFNEFKKLRKFALVMAKKRKDRERGQRIASEFIENEAEEGSDNEDHDEMVKKIDYAAEDKQYEGIDLDADLEELIDNAVDINEEDEQAAFRKYLEEGRMQDRDEIKQILRGEFRRKHEDLDMEMDEDERKRMERMEEMAREVEEREREEGKGLYIEPSEDEDYDSDEDSDMRRERKRRQAEGQEQESEDMPEEERKAMFEQFLEKTLPSAKKESAPTEFIDLGQLPQSVRNSRSSLNRTISMSRLGSKTSSDGQPMAKKSKKTSSLINQTFNKSKGAKIVQKVLPKGIFSKLK